MQIDKKDIEEICKKAGAAILEIYNNPVDSEIVDYKADDSPLTLADKASHNIINQQLKKLYPEVPIISEEGELLDYSLRKDFETYWLVDPLDGTKEFINRNGEFTVNIALIKNRRPIMGFIYVPVKATMYVGDIRTGSTKEVDGALSPLKVNNSGTDRIAVRSKSHASIEEDEVLDKYNVTNNISVGSSLKFCMVAEGKADIYYRHGPTMEWDTAAGQAILEAAGGRVLSGTGPQEFKYNKETLLNSSFLCLGFS